MKSVMHWWQGILARSLFAILGIAVILGGASSMMVNQKVAEREYHSALQRLDELLDTVENTASIAAFTHDEQLATELAQGLLRNRDVFRVVIRAGEVDLVTAERSPQATSGKVDAGTTDLRKDQVMRSLKSPFQKDLVVGEIQMDADHASIDAQVERMARDTVLLLISYLSFVLAAVAAMVYFLVVRPIKTTSDRLHRLDAVRGDTLRIPDGHDDSEIGRLVGDINELTSHLVATLEQERALQLQQSIAQRKYQDIFDHAVSGIFLANGEGQLESFNRAFAELTWLCRPNDQSGRWLDEIGWKDADRLLLLLHTALRNTAEAPAVEDDYLLQGQRGDERWLHITLMALGDGSVQGTVTDVTLRKNEEMSARRLAVTDSLTGLANRAGLQALLADVGTESPAFALAMIDLVGFKQINDAMGFPVGDQLLLMVAARIRSFLGEQDRAARIGGDEFVIVLDGAEERGVIDVRIRQLLASLAHPYVIAGTINGDEIVIGASIGLALFPFDGADLQQLLRCAELALSNVRKVGGQFCFFDPALLAAVEHRRRLEDDLRHALSAGELHVAYQPIIDFSASRLVGAEALMRWSHPTRGMVPPDTFIPLAEEIGLIGEIGFMVLNEACRQTAAWRKAGLDMYVSVNVSAHQIPDVLPPATIARVLAQHGLPVNALAIEITEGVLMSNVAVAQTWIGSLRNDGLRIYLDDFGTGYSSLSYLKRFPMDTVKIDKSFIRDLGVDSSDRTLVEAIVNMAGSLGLNVVAEGVETAAQLEILRQLGCGYGQGYFFSRPVPPHEFPAVAERINATLMAR